MFQMEKERFTKDLSRQLSSKNIIVPKPIDSDEAGLRRCTLWNRSARKTQTLRPVAEKRGFHSSAQNLAPLTENIQATPSSQDNDIHEQSANSNNRTLQRPSEILNLNLPTQHSPKTSRMRFSSNQKRLNYYTPKARAGLKSARVTLGRGAPASDAEQAPQNSERRFHRIQKLESLVLARLN